MLQTCRELGIAFIAHSPLGRAFLTGAVSVVAALAPDDFRRKAPRFQAEAIERNAALAGRLAAFAAERRVTAGQIALVWLLAKHPHVIPIPGTKRPHYAIENAQAAGIALTAAEVATLDALFDPAEVAGARYAPAGMVGIEA